MPYGTIKVDNITFTNGGSDTTITVSGLAASTTGNLTVTGTISGAVVRATTVSGVTVTGTTVQGASGTFTSITGGIATITSGVFALGSAAAPSISFSGDADNGIYSPGANQVAITTSGTQRLFIGATGDIGINVNDPGYRLDIGSNDTTAGIGYAVRIRANSTAAAAAIQFTNNPVSVQYGYIACDSSNNLKFAVSNSERVRIDSLGRLLVGTSTARANFYNSTDTGIFQVEGANDITKRFSSFIYGRDNSDGPLLLLGKHRGNSVGGTTIVASGDEIGRITFQGSDGTQFVAGAEIYGYVDNTPGADDMPGRLVFATTADGASSPTERLRITSAGLVGIGETTPVAKLHVRTDNAGSGSTPLLIQNRSVSANTAVGISFAPNTSDTADRSAIIYGVNSSGGSGNGTDLTFHTNANGSAPTEKVRITSAGLMGVGTSAPATNLDVVVGSGTATQKLGSSSVTGGSYLNLHGASASKTWFIGANYNFAGVLEFTQSTTNGGTTPSSTPAMVLSAAGNVGIGTASPSYTLDTRGAIASTSAGGIQTILSFASDGIVGTISNHSLAFFANNAERARLDTSGRLLVGTSTARANIDYALGTTGSQLQIEQANATTNFSIVQNFDSGTTGAPAILTLARSGATSIGSTTIVANGNRVGEINFSGSDGTDFTVAACIRGEVDGTPGANDMPGRLVFSTTADGASGPTERMRITSAGLVGIGTSAPSYALDVVSSDTTAGIGYALRLRHNATAGASAIQFTDNGATTQHGYIACDSSSNLKFGTGLTEKARIDSSGRLLVGTSTARSNFLAGGASALVQIERAGEGTAEFSAVRNANSTSGGLLILGKSRSAAVGGVTTITNSDQMGWISFQGADGTNLVEGASIRGEVDGTPGANDMPGRLVFSTTADGASSPTERMRITNGGNFYYWGAGGDGINVASTFAAGTTAYLFEGGYGSTGPGDFGTNSYRVYVNGNVQNTNNSYGAISDIKLKENIVDAASQWDDIKALQVRKYNFKEGQTHTQIGLVAQEVELVSPGLVSESPDRDAEGNDLGTVTKSVNYSVLYMKAVKALQEAIERIETLEAKVAALEGA